jgi:hypothetical protein
MDTVLHTPLHARVPTCTHILIPQCSVVLFVATRPDCVSNFARASLCSAEGLTVMCSCVGVWAMLVGGNPTGADAMAIAVLCLLGAGGEVLVEYGTVCDICSMALHCVPYASGP